MIDVRQPTVYIIGQMQNDSLDPVFRILSQAELARRLGVSAYAVTKWKQGRIPAERVLEIERAVGGRVTRHQLRPDLYPLDQDA